mgnify:CR=1 FL=1
MLDHFKGRMVDEGGQALVEYALLLALLAAVSLGTLNILGIKMVNVFQTIANALP